jgi:outer membrane protein assembly factor BamB
LKYGPHDITAMMDHGDHMAIIYGGRFVALAKGGRAMSILDVTQLMGTESVAIYTAIMQPDPAWVQLSDGVAYLGNGMANYYAPGNSKGRIHAVDTRTGALLWQSAQDVSNVGFVIVGPHIISGYGVHGQTSALHVIERDTGKTVSRVGLGSPPSFLVVKGTDLYVRTYDRDYVFAMR